jgi:hypothetical protein
MGMTRRIVAFLLLCSGAWAENTTSAKQFLSSIFLEYQSKKTIDHLGKAADTIFAPQLLGLIRKDEQQANGEVGLLDGDPICDCQDYQISDVRIEIKELKTSELEADVHFKNFQQEKTLNFTMVPIEKKWKIADVRSPAMPGLVEYLQKNLVALVKKPRVGDSHSVSNGISGITSITEEFINSDLITFSEKVASPLHEHFPFLRKTSGGKSANNYKGKLTAENCSIDLKFNYSRTGTPISDSLKEAQMRTCSEPHRVFKTWDSLLTANLKAPKENLRTPIWKNKNLPPEIYNRERYSWTVGKLVYDLAWDQSDTNCVQISIYEASSEGGEQSG